MGPAGNGEFTGIKGMNGIRGMGFRFFDLGVWDFDRSEVSIGA